MAPASPMPGGAAGRRAARARARAAAAACALPAALVVLVSGCTSTPAPSGAPAPAALASPAAQAPASAVPPPGAPGPVLAQPQVPAPPLETGLYRCELDRRVTVRRTDPDRRSLVLVWQGRDHAMTSVPARSGALRYESAQAGLTWLVLADKSMLLDSRRGRQLANECRL